MADLDAWLAGTAIEPGDVSRAEAEGGLELLVIEHLLRPEPPRYDLETLAVRAGIAPRQMHQLWRAMGFTDPEPGSAVSGEEDIEVLDWARDRISDPEQFDRLLQLLRITSSSFSRIAEATADDIADRLAAAREAGADAREAAGLVLDLFDLGDIQKVLFHLFRLQLLDAVRRRLSEDRLHGLEQVLSVGFVDLVGFTAISQELEPDELAAMVTEFEARAQSTVAEEGGRLVKTIGDEVMFSAPSPQIAVRIALRLARDDRRGPNTPDVRAGVAYGPVIPQWGDIFGPVVNLASRLVNVALPGTVLVSHDVHDLLADDPDLHWREVRPRRLKGIGRVRLWVVRPA